MLAKVVGPDGIFGPVEGYVWSLEYQKRGNKHWHLVVMLKRAPNGADLDTPEWIDQYISAKIPDVPEPGDPLFQQKMYYWRMVKDLYLHDCEDNPQAACRVNQPDNMCRFGYPKPYSEFTTVNADRGDSVVYARPSPEHGGNSIVKRSGGREKVFDNRYVVPHNPYLSMQEGCHVCIEYITRFRCWL